MTAGLPVTERIPSARRIMFALGASLVLAIAGCGDGGGDQQAASASNSPTSTANSAPAITGTPNAQAMVGVAYAFQPAASDADGNTLTFSISGMPAWATFSTTTGLLSGTPGTGDVGTSSNIVISVSDGNVQTALASFRVTVVAVATGSATLSWTPPTQNTDGSALTNLSGYKIYWGTNQNNLSNSVTLNNPGLATYVVTSLTPATWYFAVTSVNASNVESDPSNVASKVIL